MIVMKNKYLIIGITFILLIGFSCVYFIFFQYDVITCTDSIKENTYSINNSYKIYYRDDLVKSVIVEWKIESNNNTLTDYFIKNYKDDFKKSNKEYGGYTIKSETNEDGAKVIAKIDFDKVDFSKLLEKKSYLKDDVKNKKIKISGIYKLLQIDENSCKGEK